MVRFGRIGLLVIILAATVSLFLSTGRRAFAETGARAPLLMEGKKTLHQRALARPGAQLFRPTEGHARGEPVDAFTIFYVYDRRNIENIDWVEVGLASQPPTDGWIPAEMLIDWKQTLTVAFTNPSGRKRLLFFKDRDGLIDLLESETLFKQSRALREIALAGQVAEEFPIVSIEPSVHVDIRDQFYLLPIMSAEEVFLSSGFTTRVLEIASVTREQRGEDRLSDAERHKELARAADADKKSIQGFRNAIVFVIDSTASMGPYIDRTRAIVRAVYKAVEEKGLTDQVSFGLVAYRDNIDDVPDLEYVTRIFVDLQAGTDAAQFLAASESVTPASVSSRGFIEDAYTGVKTAITKFDWSAFGGRYVVLITDAGARTGTDQLGKTRMDAAQVRLLALDKNIALYSLHLLTEEGRANHRPAALQYSELSDHPNAGSLYFPIEAGAVEDFSSRLQIMTDALSDQIAQANEGRLIDLDAAGGGKDGQDAGAADSESQRIANATRRVGHAMQLAYLGTKTGGRAPTLFKAWVIDRDFENVDTASLEVRVLLTKNQLSDLQQALKLIVESAKLAEVSPEDFFSQLKSAAAAMSRTPDAVAAQDAAAIAELNLLGEYIDDLPYKSKVMNVDEDLWLSWNAGEQQAFIEEIEAKLNLYQNYHNDVDRWIALDQGRIPGDAVYPLPLDALP